MECKTYTVDRIEGEYAVCEDENGEMVNIPLSHIKGKVSDGVTLTDEGECYIARKNNSTSNRELFNKIFKKGH